MYKKIGFYINEVDKIQRGEFVAPITCNINPSNRCQNRCNFCLFKDKLGNVDLDYDLYVRLIHELAYLGTKAIVFSGGGEPLMHPRFGDMIAEARCRDFELGLITNGVQLDQYIEALYNFSFVRISLDAATAETYKKIKVANNFDRVRFGIEALMMKRGPNTIVGVSFLTTKENIHEVGKAQELADHWGVDYIQIKPAYDLVTEGISTIKVVPTKPSQVITRHAAPGGLTCAIAGLKAVVCADGGVYYCCVKKDDPDFFLGSLYEESFSSIWSRRSHFKPDIPKCGPCVYADYLEEYQKALAGNPLCYRHKNFL